MLASHDHSPGNAAVEEFRLSKDIRHEPRSCYDRVSQQTPRLVQLSSGRSVTDKPRVVFDCHSRSQSLFGFGNVVMIRRNLEATTPASANSFLRARGSRKLESVAVGHDCTGAGSATTKLMPRIALGRRGVLEFLCPDDDAIELAGAASETGCFRGNQSSMRGS
jgi:hypothetical protein